ncbi:MAG: nitrate ABC transporter permease [Cytophagaceae bacterium]|jgi:nitrate/nitrite transport system permease protein|nr:nitrate ABC transporter permease [Cytophagaceae bacterium]
MKTMTLKSFLPGLTDKSTGAASAPVFSQSIYIVKQTLTNLFLSLVGIGLFLLMWEGISVYLDRNLPGPLATLTVLWSMISNPWYDNGPNDKGIGLQLMMSIERVFKGFSIATILAIPVGVLLGSSKLFYKMFDPIVQILKPVSPLAWFPIGLVALKNAGSATVFIIFITSLWPTLINTAVGVASIPDDFRNVSKAFGFSPFRYITKVLLPYSVPHIITGLRLSIGVAWLVIVAGEMLSGGTGIGFFVWDSWNALSLEKVISAIIIIGTVGLLLDRFFLFLGKKFSYK